MTSSGQVLASWVRTTAPGQWPGTMTPMDQPSPRTVTIRRQPWDAADTVTLALNWVGWGCGGVGGSHGR